MANSNGFSIYTGHVWIYEGDGRHILTLSGSPAAALQAAIPIFVTLVGPMLWIVIKYVWYQLSVYRATAAIDPLYDQQKFVLLRNSVGDLGTSIDSIKLCFSWRKVRSRRRMSAAIALIFTGALYFFAWQIAGVFSSAIWTQAVPSLGLIQSDVCGYANLTDASAELQFLRTGLAQTILSETYVSQCYGVNSSNFGACSTYASQALNFKGVDADCPFTNPDICITTNSTPYLLYTDVIDSHADLGINAAPKDRVTYEKYTTCSPVHSTGFAQTLNASDSDEAGLWPLDTILQRFYFGPTTLSNWTFEYSEWAAADGFGYEIRLETKPASSTTADDKLHSGQTYNPDYLEDDFVQVWLPNPNFCSRTDADVMVFFFTQNHILYSTPVYDPFFITGEGYVPPGGTQTLLASKYYVTVMGCIEQHRICDPNRPNSAKACSSLVSYNQLASDIFTIGLNPLQLATAELIVFNLLSTNTFNSVYGRRAASLLASQTVHEVLQTKILPVDQWRLEVENWFAVSLAKLQLQVVEFSGGPVNKELLPYIQRWDPESAKLCDMQLIQLPSGYTNFNFDLIIIITAVGGFIMVLGACFEHLGAWLLKLLTRRPRYGRPERVEGWLRWVKDGPFQLQKRMFEEAGMGEWRDSEHHIPISREAIPESRVLRRQSQPVRPVGRGGAEALSLTVLPTPVPDGSGTGTTTSVGGAPNARNYAMPATIRVADAVRRPFSQADSITSMTPLISTTIDTRPDSVVTAGIISPNSSQTHLNIAPSAVGPEGRLSTDSGVPGNPYLDVESHFLSRQSYNDGQEHDD